MRFAAYVVDDTLAFLLGTIEEARFSGLEVQVKDSDGETHVLEQISDGLEGELYTSDGWIARFGTSYTEVRDGETSNGTA